METTVYKIEKNNINRPRYLNVMNSWNNDASYKIDKDASLYAIAFDDKFLAGAVVNTNSNMINVLMINNSINHANEIYNSAVTQLIELIDAEYGQKGKIVKHIKRK